MTPPSSPLGYRPHLDGIRAVAVVMVILFHLGYSWVPGGFVGVDVFFVLSGYLITSLLVGEAAGSGGVRLARFYGRRVRRLLPASILVLAAVMVCGVVLLDPVQRQSLGMDATAAALYSANWRFAFVGGDYFAPGDVPSALVHYWSLAVEEQFYLVWPWLFVVLFKWSTRRRGSEATGGLIAVVAALTAASAVASVALVGSSTTYYGTDTRAYQLLAGGLLALVARKADLRFPDDRSGRRLANGAVVVGLGALIFLGHTIEDAVRYPGWPGIAVTVASLALIAGLDLSSQGPAQAVIGHRSMAAIGRLSYSLYIWHWPVVVFAPLFALRWHSSWLDSRPTMIAVMVSLALGSYLLVERPVRFRLRLRAAPIAVVGVGLTMSVLIGAVAAPVLSGGRPYGLFSGNDFQTQALKTVRDRALDGPCPYLPQDWGDPSTSEPCVYRKGRPGGKVIAIVGDSHAQQWQPAIEILAKRDDATVVRVTRGGCPANDVLANATGADGRRTADTDCQKWRHRVYRLLIERFDPDIVFVATRSHVRGITVGSRDVLPGDPTYLRIWSAGWPWTLDTLSAGGAQVVVSEIIPTMPRRIPACLISYGRDSKQCGFAVSVDRKVPPFNAVIAGLADPARHISVINPTPIACPGGFCPAMMGDIIVHRDDNHLSATFVRSRTDAFRRLLASVGVVI